MSEVVSWCRLCDGVCGVVAHVDGRVSLDGDRESPASHGFLCDDGRASAGWVRSSARATRPLKREGDRLVPVDWEPAIREIGDRLGKIRREGGARAVAVYAGAPVGASAKDAARVAAFALAMGTPNLFSAAAQTQSPFLLATERVLGHAAPLLSDVGRAHYTVLLGGNQSTGDWGPFMAGSVHLEQLRSARKSKKSRLVVVDPRKTPLAATADVHLPIRPGTDVHLLLGMLGAVLQGGWQDEQYVRDYTRGLDTLRDAVSGWTPERAAEACGVDRGALSGVALKFARAAMGVVHRGRGMMLGGDATVASFALLALHAVTANLLRPGGLYDNPGVVDLEALGRAFPASKAPRSRVSGVPAVALQLPVSLLAEEILTPGDGRVRALVSVDGDPARTAASTSSVEKALADLELLVTTGPFDSATARFAHFVLPTVHFWERGDDRLAETALLPWRLAQRTSPVVEPPPGARTVDAVLADVLAAARPPLRGGEWGAHLQIAGRVLGRADLGRWEQRAWSLLSDVPREDVEAAPHGVDRGDVDRTRWRVSTADERIALDPADMLEAIRAVEAPGADADRPFFFGSRSRTVGRPLAAPEADVEPIVELSPAAAERLGLAEGARVVVVGEGGEVRGRLAVDADLVRDDTVVVAGGWGVSPEAGGVRPAVLAAVGDRRDPFTGAPAIAGARVAVRKG